jgi:hypothetical protein
MEKSLLTMMALNALEKVDIGNMTGRGWGFVALG